MFYLLELLIKLNFPQVKSVSIPKFSLWLDEQSSSIPLIIDARASEEYAVSHIESAQIIEANNSGIPQLSEVPLNTRIVVYCSVGYRSAKVAQQLQRAGYQNVFNLSGGIFQWVNRGKPIYQDNRQVEIVHPYNFIWGKLLKSKYHASMKG
ncbi:Rhodanese-related sulfurtransferase [Rivularia sp. PCC 7116]|uniref:rhodanese-like domain-containing protein n=1 Tax=Rivularia sp. PCC 7116 TaxID=373994 RepID=UPI00029F293B|nr:rhodanese-like domain-containing protein [Rivularia sp. PCC 7116]AFY58418.1 Rhodanese-related sulfurtransferase [Rivularia sp. PCC 7116]